MSKKGKYTSKFNIIDAILLIMPLFYGIFPIWSCALLGIICICGILYKYSKNKQMVLPKGLSIYLLLFYILSFLITEFVAIDKGMNILAFIKNIPIILFIVLLAQFKETIKEEDRHYYMISISSAASVIISILLMLIPGLNIYLNSRLQGVFFYANSYGLFLLIGVLVLLLRKNRKWYDYIMFAILFIGIVLTNSRAIIVMTIILSIATLFFNKERIKSSIIVISCFVITFIAGYFLFNIEKRISEIEAVKDSPEADCAALTEEVRSLKEQKKKGLLLFLVITLTIQKDLVSLSLMNTITQLEL